MTTWPPPAASAPGQEGRGQASAGHRCDGRGWDPPAAAAPSRPPLERLEARDRDGEMRERRRTGGGRGRAPAARKGWRGAGHEEDE